MIYEIDLCNEEQMRQIYDTNLIDFSKGNIINFVQEYMGASDLKSAAERILNCRAYEQAEHDISPVEKELCGNSVLPDKDKNFDRTIAYLTRTCGIDKEIVYAVIEQGKVYGARTISEKTGYSFHNCAFVGYDENGKPRYCALRTPVLTAISGRTLKTQIRLKKAR